MTSELPEGWRFARLGDVVEINPREPMPPEDAPFIPMASVEEGCSGRIAMLETRGRRNGPRFRGGDVLFARITPSLENGKVGRVPTSTPLGAASTEFLVLRAIEGLTISDFVFRLAIWTPLRAQATKMMVGTSGRQRVAASDLGGIQVPLPPLREQQAIAEMLGAIDDKIEVNRRLLGALDELAWAIFNEWFGPYLKVAEEELPEGWSICRFGEVAVVTAGQSPPGASLNEAGKGRPFYQGAKDFGYLYPRRRVFTTEPKRWAQAGDLLLSVRAPVGRVNRVMEDCVIGRGLMAIRAVEGVSEPSYLEFYLRWLEGLWGHHTDEGAVFPNLSKKSLLKLRLRVPPITQQRSFADVTASDLEAVLSVESHRLAELRDALLPKLLSGEIRLVEAEKMVEEAV